jgi:hypothetical protein
MNSFDDPVGGPPRSWEQESDWATPLAGNSHPVLPLVPARVVAPVRRIPPRPVLRVPVVPLGRFFGGDDDDPWGFRGPIFGR